MTSRTLLLRRFFVYVALTVFAISVANSQALLVENFEYAEGAQLTANGWTAHSVGANPILTVSPGLVFPGYYSNTGLAAGVNNTGEDLNKTFTGQTSGTVYAAFVIQTTNPGSAGYFLHFGQSTIGTTYFTRVWVNATGDGVGLGTTAPATYTTIPVGVPVLLAIKYDIVTKVSSLFVMETFQSTEPQTPNATFQETGTYTNVGSIALRQFSASQRIIVDGIRVATSWSEAVKAAPSNNANLSSLTLSNGTLNPEFSQSLTTYFVNLPYGTTVVPTITANTVNAGATVLITDASSLPGASTVQVTAEDGITINTYTVNFSISPEATAALSGGGFICPGSSSYITFTLTGTAPWSLTYSDGVTPVSISNILTSPHVISVSPASSSTYSLTAFSDNFGNGTTSGTAQVNVDIQPEISSVTNGANCGVGTVTLGASSATGSIMWYSDAACTNYLAFGTSYTTSQLSETTDFYVKAMSAMGCSSLASTVTATIDAIATANAGSDASITAGETYTLAGVIGGSATSLTWSTTGTGTFNDASLASAIYTPSSDDILSGTVTLTLTTNDPSGSCLAAADQMILTITPASSLAVSSPNGGESWQAGSTQNITWSSAGISSVKIKLWNNSVFTTIASGIQASLGTYAWSIPAGTAVGADYKIFVMSSDSSLTDFSDNTFSITAAPTVTVTYPNGGEVLYGGQPYAITWTSSGIENVKIEFSSDNMMSWQTVVESTPAAIGTYSWICPALATKFGFIKISDASNTAVNDASNARFNTIYNTITITSPNGGESWAAGSVHNITWNVTGQTYSVHIYLSTDNGSNWTVFPGWQSGGSYAWTVPNTPSAQCKIKIEDLSIPVFYDTSDAVFTISEPQPYVTVSTPNGGETLTAGATYNITWSSYGVNYLNLYYSTNNGTSWNFINDGIQASLGTYAWTVPSIASSQYLIKIEDLSNTSINDVSNATFTVNIPTSVTVTSPNGGESWQAGTTHDINWTSSGISTVKIKLMNNAIESTIAVVAANLGTYSWSIPTYLTPSGMYYIHIMSLDSVYNDYSNMSFTITAPPASVTLTSPNGGETLTAGANHNITWTSNGVSQIDLYYSTNNGTNWTMINDLIQASAGSYSWTVPSSASSQCKVKIQSSSNSSVNDESNAVFSITVPSASLGLESPNGGETFTVGTSAYIMWYHTNVNYLNLYYSTNNGTDWIFINDGVQASLSNYEWIIPNTPSTQCLVKVEDGSNPDVFAVSNAVFTIAAAGPSVVLTAPNGGENWTVGTQHNITWTSSGVTQVDLFYSTDNGADWFMINDLIQASAGSFSWTVPSSASTQCKVKIQSSSNSTINDVSNAVFTIANPVTSLTLTAPNGWENWSAGTTRNILWNSSNVSMVNLYYSTNHGANWQMINDGITASAGSYAWTVPAENSSACKVKIEDMSNSSVFDLSDTTFTISPAPTITVTSPNGGESWQAGSAQTISWTSSGVMYVNITLVNGPMSTTIASNQYAPAGSYTWNIPSNTAPGTQYQIWVQQSGGSVYDNSNAYFTITAPTSPSLTLTSPNGGETWTAGTTQNITWNSTGISNVKIKLYNNAIESTIAVVPASSGSYSWSIPANTNPSSLYMVHIMSEDSLYHDYSNNNFTISAAPSITLTSPVGGENWPVGSQHNITWNSTGVQNVFISYSTNSGSTWELLNNGNSMSASIGYYNWTIPNTPSGQCQVKVSDRSNGSVFASNFLPFTISAATASITLTAPNGGENWTAGSTRSITWQSTGVNYVNIYYSTNNGSTWSFVNDGIQASIGYYTWTVPNTLSDLCKVKIESNENTSVNDISATAFTISAEATLTLTSPAGDEIWQAGSVQNITWTSSNVSNIMIEYSINGGTDWTMVNDYVDASTGTYQWEIPNTPSQQCIVKLISLQNPNLTSSNLAYFTIQSQAVVSNAISLNGTSDYIEVPDNAEWDLQGNFTISLWVKLNSTANNPMFMSHESNGGVGGFEFYYDGSNIKFNSSNTNNVISTASTLNTGVWYNLVVQRSSQMANLFVNGVNVGDGYCPTISSVDGFLRIGGYCCPGAGFVNGHMDDVSIWNRALNSAEIAALYVNPTLAGTEQGLVAYWDMNVTGSGAGITVPNRAGGKVAGVNGTTRGTASTPVFVPHSTQGSITMESPNGGENWQVGTQQTIAWFSSDVTYLNLYYSTNNGTDWTFINDGVLASNGSYTWTVPNSPSTQCLVKVEDASNSSVFAVSQAVFTISAATPSLTLTSPVGGETWQAGTTHNITWTASGLSTIKIKMYGTSDAAIATNVNASLGTYSWTIPSNTAPGSYMIYLMKPDSSMFAGFVSINITSPAASLTLTAPNGWENWTAGTSHNITWNSSNVSMVNLYYSTNHGANWQMIGDGITASSGSYAWTVPAENSSACKVKIEDMSNSSLYDMSDTTFTISPAPSITVTSPNGGESWQAGTTQTITWTSSGVMYVNITLVNGPMSTTIASNQYAPAGSYTWNIPSNTTPGTQYQVWVQQSGGSVYDNSNAYFTITSPATETLTLTAPNGGETWTAGTTQNITWTSSGVSTVDLLYSTNNGTNWTWINDMIQASAGTYSWTVPSAPSANCLVKVQSSSNTSLNDVSNSQFTIVASTPQILTVYPDSVNSGVQTTIYIQSQGMNYGGNDTCWFRNGNYWKTPTSVNAVNANLLMANVTFTGADPSGWYDVIVNNAADGTYMKSAVVYLRPAAASITVTSPNGGESWEAGSVHNITWTSSGVSQVDIFYSTDNGADWFMVNDLIQASAGSYSWVVPSSASSQCKVKVQSSINSSVNDISNSVFTISVPVATLGIESPNGGESYTVGSQAYIMWYHTNVNYLNLYYSTNNGIDWIFINDGIQASQSNYAWTIPNTPSTQCLVKVEDASNPNVFAVSSGVFTIQPMVSNITVTSPNGGEAWQAGTQNYITWQSSGVNRVDLYYSTNGGFAWTLIGDSIQNGNSFAWVVPNNVCTLAMVKVVNTDSTEIFDSSNNVFSITEPGVLGLESPNGGETWTAGTEQTIAWYSMNVNFINIYYSTNNGQTWSFITDNVEASSGSYSWIVPGTPSSQCKVKIADASNALLTAVSSDIFTILQNSFITVNVPNGGETYTTGSTQNISWDSYGVSMVNIYYTVNNGMNWTLIADSVQAIAGTYSWIVPNNPSTQCKVKVENVANVGLFDISNAVFTIAQPVSGEWVTSIAAFSSQYSASSWSANQIVGAPNAYPQYGDIAQAWASQSSDNQREWLNLNFNNSTPINTVRIYETFNPGAVDTVYTWNPAAGSWDRVWSGTASHAGNVSRINIIQFAATSYNVNKVRLAINSPAVNGWNEIDAVGISLGALQPTITVTSPNGGENWQVGALKNITWTSTAVDSVNIYYCTDGGTQWILVADSIPATSGSFAWTVPNTASIYCKVKITDYSSAAVNDISNNVFVISTMTALTLTSPNGGESWQAGSTQNITWTSTGVNYLNLYYSTNGGTNWTFITDGVLASSGSFTWTVPSVLSNNCYVKIENANNTSLYDISNSYFAITGTPSLVLVSPNGSESWNVGSVQNIYWTGENVSNNLALYLSTTGGAPWTLISSGLSNSGNYQWTVPNSITDNARVRIVDGNSIFVRDSSDNVFSIRASGSQGITLTSPVGGETWLAGSGQDITWTYNYSPATSVKVEFSSDNGSTWSIVSSSTSVGTQGNGSYYWDGVPSITSDQCKIKVSDVLNPAIRSVSPNVFSIMNPTVTVTYPNGGETFTVGSTYEISWTNVGDMFYAAIYYSTNGGTTWSIVNDGVQNTGIYNWTVPNTPSTNCLVKVADAFSGTPVDVSDNTFTIAAAQMPSISLVTPQGGENWTVGGQQYIVWNSTNIANVKLEYSTNNGTAWSLIAQSLPALNQSYFWTIPNTPSSQCKVRVSDASNSSLFAQNSVNFTISAAQAQQILYVAPDTVYQGQTVDIYIYSQGMHYGGNDTCWFRQGNTWVTPNSVVSVSANVLKATTNFTASHPTGLYEVIVYNSTDGTYQKSNVLYVGPAQSNITVTSPNGGENWIAGSTHNITWTSSGVNYINLYYSTNSGTNWIFINDGIQASAGSYTWTVPDVNSPNCLVKAEDGSNTSIFDISNSRFTITPSTYVTVNSPNGGETWTAGTTRNITWTSAGISYLNLYYSTNNGTDWVFINDGIQASAGYYVWTVPNVNSQMCLVKAENSANTSITDVSNQVFSILIPTPIVSNVNPSTATQGDSRTLWITTANAHNTQGSVQVTLTQGATVITGTNVSVQNANYLSAAFSFTTSHNPGYYDVKVTNPVDGQLVKTSGFYLNQLVSQITVTSPNGGENWIAGSLRNITWTSTGVSRVDIEFSSNGGTTWQLIADSIASTGSYSWTVPSITSSNCRIRVTNASNVTLSDISNNAFSIVTPIITVTQPNGGEVFVGGTTQQIKWTSQGVSNYVIIELSTNSGNTWSTLAGSAYNNGTYNWTIPNQMSDLCLVRVKDYYSQSVSDISNAEFSIQPTPPSVTLNSPNGGEQWLGGSQQTIYWSSVNVDTLLLQYSVDNGATWYEIADSVFASLNSYSWLVPDSSSQQVKVRVSDMYNATVNDASNSVFSILTPEIALTVPNGGESWEGGTIQNITWTSNDISYVTIQYSTNNGSNWSYIANGIYNNNSYEWTVPNTPSTQCLVKVTDYSYSQFNDLSDAAFTITQTPPSVTVTTPNGGETWLFGSTQYIYWNSVSVNNVKISYSTNNGADWTVINPSVSASSGYYAWAIPSASSNQCKVKVEDAANAAVNDESNSVFTIAVPVIALTSPNGGEVWVAGTQHAITWTSQNVSNYVTIEYSINNGSSWNMVYNGAYNNGTYNWTVPNNPSIQCKVKVRNYYNAGVFDESNSTFTIEQAPMALTLTSPNGGENLAAGTTHYISWTSTSINNISISYSVNGGIDWQVIAPSVSASAGSYAWTVPSTPSGQCLVKLVNVDNASVADQSNSMFSIVVPVISVTSPVGGESWTGGEYRNITWTSNYSSNYVNIEYSVNNGSSWQAISNYEYNDGSYSWLVPNNPSTQCLVRVKDAYSTTLSGTSAEVFTILSTPPSITLNYPNGFENLLAGSSCNISWSSVSINNVKIEYTIDNGQNWNIISASVPAINGSYSWSVPNTPSSQCMVKVSDASNASISDASNSKFNIVVPVISVTSPNGGETWAASTYKTITWTSSNVSQYVRIEYSTDNGISWSNVISQKYNNGSYSWMVPNTPSAQCIVKVSDYYNASISDVSNTIFEILPIPPSVTVVYPNGYENLLAGSTVAIDWNYVNVNDVKLEYTIDNGSTWNTIVSSTSASNKPYPWVVPTTTSTQCRVKISDVSNSAVTDMSNNLFNITTPFITVTSPNGGQQWSAGSVRNITWSSNGVQNVKIEYTYNSGASWTIIASSVQNTGSYNWTVPNTPSNTCRVRIRDVANTSVFDVSDNTFSIPFPSVVLNTPNGGQQWAVGSSQYIYWTATSVSNVKLEYTTDGTVWNLITASTAASAGNYLWVVPNAPSATCKIKVTNAAMSSINDVSENNFSIIAPSITVLTPAGGENWMVGSTRTITWTSLGVGSYVKIELSTNGGSNWTTIAGSRYNNGTFSWVVSNTPSTDCKIRVSDVQNATVNGVSAMPFTIAAGQPSIALITPNGGQSWGVGSTRSIQWNSLNMANVKLEYTTNNGSSWITIAASTPATAGTYSWNIPNTPSVNCKVRVRDIDNPTVFDESDNVFTIPGPSVTVTTPNGGEHWGVGSVKSIYWNSISVQTVKIEYTTNNGTDWVVVSDSMPASAGAYSWTIPNTPSTDCKVRVSDKNALNVSDMSNAAFSIDAPQITLVSPNGGESWDGLSGHNIQWTGSGLSSSVKIEFSTDNGSTWTVITNNAPNINWYYWTVPNITAADCKIRVSDYANSSISDESNDVFALTQVNPSITLNAPNGGENWIVGSSYYIYWSTIAVNNVKIEYTVNDTAWSIISNSVPASSGSYYWTIPNTPSTTCKVRISDASNNQVFDASSAYFAISQPIPSLTLTSPNGGEQWTVGDYQYITWTSNVVQNVKIEISYNNGTSWNLISASAPAAQGSYYYNVPNTPSNNCKIRLRDVSNLSLFDASNTTFRIIPVVVNNNVQLVDSISSYKVCKGDTIKVYYHASGTYNAANIFRLQMSDSQGSFTSPVEIGTKMTNDTIGFVEGIIPVTVSNGTGYKFRVNSTDWFKVGTASDSSVTVSSPEFDFYADNTLKYLPDGRVQCFYQGADTTVNYLWEFANGDTDTLRDPIYNFNAVGFYTVKLSVANESGCVVTVAKQNYIDIEQIFPTLPLSPIDSNDMNSIVMVDIFNGFTVGNGGSMAVTHNGGVSWSDINSGTTLDLTCIAALDTANIFVAGTNGFIQKSDDGGLSWTILPTGTSETIKAMAFKNSTEGYAVGTGGTILSFDGSVWTADNSAGVSIDLNGIHVDTTSGDIFIVGENGSIYTGAVSSWSLQNSPVSQDLNDISMFGTYGLAVGNNGTVIKTTDGGTSWDLAFNGIEADFTRVQIKDADTAWAVGRGGVVYQTTDGGATFVRFSIGDTIDLSGFYYARPYIGTKAQGSNSGRGVIVGKDGAAFVFGPNLIAVSSIGTNVVCVGSQINIPFFVTGTYNPGNTFTAQLSDEFGDFSNAVTIGTFNGIEKDTIHATIPLASSTGSGFLIRVNASDVAVDGAPSEYELTLAGLPVVALGNDTSLCAGGSIVLDANSPSDLVVWSTGDSTQTLSVNTTSTISVVVTNNNGCKADDEVVVTFVDYPVVNLGNDTTICANTPLVLNAQNTGSAYLWSDGSSLQSLTVSASDTFAVTVTNPTGCATTDSIALTVNDLPVVTISNMDTVYCSFVAEVAPILTPAGGVLSGPGTLTDKFYPPVAGEGTHSLIYTYTDAVTGCYNSDTITVRVRNCTEIESSVFNTNVSVYPNPVSTHVFVEFELTTPKDVTIRIVDITGKEVEFRTIEATSAGKYTVKIDTERLAPGTYMIGLRQAGEEIQKILVK